MADNEITIIFDDYLRYRRALLRDRHKEAVMESFRKANPSAGPKRNRPFRMRWKLP